MKKRIKKMISVFFIILFAMNFGGCTLAVEEGKAEINSGDHLIGGLLTRNPIEKTYGTYEWISPIGGTRHIENLQFEGVEGMVFYGYDYKISGEDTGVFIWARGDEMNVNGNIIEKDGKREIKLHAETYYVPRGNEAEELFYLNPIYKSADGEVYVVPGERSVSGIGAASYTMSFKQESKRTLLDDSVIDSFEISIEVKRIEEPLHIWISQMTENDEIIKREEFTPNKSDFNFSIEPETAYLIIETKTRLSSGETVMKREIVDWEGDMTSTEDENGNEYEYRSSDFFTYYPVVDGFWGKNFTHIRWPEYLKR